MTATLTPPHWQSAAWLRAFSLNERLAARAAGSAWTGAHDRARASRRLERWRSAQPPFGQEYPFSRRLALDGIGEEDLLLLLGEPDEALAGYLPTRPGWLAQLAEAFAATAGADRTAGALAAWDDSARFLDTVWPLVNWGCDRLSRGAAALAQDRSSTPFDPGTIPDIFLPELGNRLLPMLSRTLVLELNVARLRGLLQGDTNAQRFDSFLGRFRHPEACLELLVEYPVLARLLVEAVDVWVSTSLEFLARLCEDWPLIRLSLMAGQEAGVLVEVDGTLGDRHQGGRATLLTRFSSGRRLVYKPRPIGALAHFQDLLAWINRLDDRPGFRTLPVLNRGAYGWVEFVAYQPCRSLDEIAAFYQRQGGYLALLHTLVAQDMHLENLVAAGEHPVLVDMECLFQPELYPRELANPSGRDTGFLFHPDILPPEVQSLAESRENRSIFYTGLLPYPVWATQARPGIDLSGLGGWKGQMTPQSLPLFEAAGTDEMHLVRQRMPIDASLNRPSLDGADVRLVDHLPALIEGFEHVYCLLYRHRAELLAGSGPFGLLACDQMRVIFRDTFSYSLLLGESYHPDVLRDALDRDRVLDYLWVGASQQPDFPKIIPGERVDLLCGDIPFFTTLPDSTDVWDSTGQRIPSLLRETGLARVQRRLLRLSDEDMAQQVRNIEYGIRRFSHD